MELQTTKATARERRLIHTSKIRCFCRGTVAAVMLQSNEIAPDTHDPGHKTSWRFLPYLSDWRHQAPSPARWRILIVAVRPRRRNSNVVAVADRDGDEVFLISCRVSI